MQTKKIRNDLILVSVFLLLALIIFLIFKSNSKKGDFATISINGEITNSYPLDRNTETVIKSGENFENVLVIENGEAFIKSANCRDKICVHHRKISKIGETIVCLPHKTVVEITAK